MCNLYVLHARPVLGQGCLELNDNLRELWLVTCAAFRHKPSTLVYAG